MIDTTTKLNSYFFARSLSANGTKRNLPASSPKWCILFMTHTFSNSLMKKYESADSKPWNLGRVLMNCDYDWDVGNGLTLSDQCCFGFMRKSYDFSSLNCTFGIRIVMGP